MKIVMVADPFVAVPPEKYGGTERVIFYLIKGLMERGHEVILLASGDSKVDCRLIPICKEHIFFGKDEKEEKIKQKQAAAIRYRTKKILKDILPDADIVHSHHFDLIDFQNYPNLTTLHGPILMSDLKYFNKRSGLFYASISDNQQEGYPDLQYVGICYDGLDPDAFPFTAKPTEYLCFIGRFDQEKNPHLAIELALKLGMKIKIAGKLDFRGQEYFKRMIKPHLDNPLVEYMGEIGMKEKIDLISHARVNIHPTGFKEPFGLTVLESAYCGTPTLAIDRGSMPELIEDGRTGLLVEDFVEAYHHMQDLFNMDRSYISQRARSLFNYKTMAKQYEIAYQKVIEVFDLRKKFTKKTLKQMQVMRNILRGAWVDVKTGS